MLGGLLLFLGPVTPASATLIVDWGGEYTSGSSQMLPGGFSGTTPLEATPATGYDSGGTSARFYGQLATTDPAGITQMDVVNGTPDRFQFKTANNSAYEALVLWLSQDFLGAAQNQAVALPSASDTVVMNINTHAAIDPTRLVVQRGADYYISDGFTSTTGLVQVDPTALSWYHYDPSVSLDFNAADAIPGNDATSTVVVGGQIPGVTAVGLFSSRSAVTSQGNALRFDRFEVNAIVVPEPATWALAMAGMIALFPLLRRRQSQR